MGFKTKTRYRLVKENYVSKDWVRDTDSIELTEQQLLDLSYGIIPFAVIETIIKWLKESGKE